MKYFRSILLIIVVGALHGLAVAHADSRIRDIVNVEGVRGNDLVGFGIVVGLNGTGDSVKNSPFTEDSLSNMLERLGVNVQGEDIKPNNVAAVLVTATLPPFARRGSTIDVNVSSIGDAKSLAGGLLILTPLSGADNSIYAVAQGSVFVSGMSAEGQGARQTQGTPTGGSIANGARVEQEISHKFNDSTNLTLALRNPDFTTAARIEDTINKATGLMLASMLDPGTISLNLRNQAKSPARLLAEIENLTVKVSQPARIVIDEKSGTIVLGEDVSISTVAIAQGSISIKIIESPVTSQPNPFSPNGETIVLPRTDIEVTQTGTQSIALLDNNITLSDLIAGLNALGVSPREMIDIIRAMKAAGAIQADIIMR